MSAYWSSEYRAIKGEVGLHVWRKRVGAPTRGVADLPLLFLVHGSSFSARSGYDLQVPGKQGYSMMEAFADWGFDVWIMDFEGYGRSDWGEGV
ncbi:MAG: hypothetical protein E2O90_05905, partial [Alphaproteobacteria bacterium]